MGNGNNNGGGDGMILFLIIGMLGIAMCLSSSAACGYAWYSGWFDESTQPPTPPAGGAQWVCPSGYSWGWGANAGKCCKDGKCVSAVKSDSTSATAAKWVCPAGYNGGWGANAGKCCKDGKCFSAVKA